MLDFLKNYFLVAFEAILYMFGVISSSKMFLLYEALPSMNLISCYISKENIVTLPKSSLGYSNSVVPCALLICLGSLTPFLWALFMAGLSCLIVTGAVALSWFPLKLFYWVNGGTLPPSGLAQSVISSLGAVSGHASSALDLAGFVKGQQRVRFLYLLTPREASSSVFAFRRKRIHSMSSLTF